jgi:hypothetical protein
MRSVLSQNLPEIAEQRIAPASGPGRLEKRTVHFRDDFAISQKWPVQSKEIVSDRRAQIVGPGGIWDFIAALPVEPLRPR